MQDYICRLFQSTFNPTFFLLLGEKNMTCMDLTVWVNDTLGLEGDNKYKEGAIWKWLHSCGFKVMENKKGCYFDGHERDDVVKVCYF